MATSVYSDNAGHHLVGWSHNRGGQALFTPYSWTYDPLDRIVEMVHADGTSSYSYDQTDQLVGADHSYQPDEAYQFDANGNRTGGGYVVGANNQLLEDGTYRYQYDAEGNRTVKENITTGERQEYTWDHRNRLVQIQVRDAQGTLVRDIQYVYDVFDRRIAKAVDPDGGGPQAVVVSRYVLDNPSVVTGAADPALVGADHIVLEFAGEQPATLRHRYLYGPVVDQIFAREDVESLWQPGEVLWPLGDHLGTVRDILGSAGNVVNHLRYDSFGRITSETNTAVDFLFAFTGRERDEESGLYFYRARYYDPQVGRFVSEDPLGFAAGDGNLARYVGNSPLTLTDPAGLQAPQRRRRDGGFRLFGENWVWPWSEDAAGVCDTARAYGRAACQAAAGAGAGAATGATTGALTGAGVGAIIGSGAGRIGALPGAGAGAASGAIGGAIAGGVSGLISAAFAPDIKGAAYGGAVARAVGGGLGGGAGAYGAVGARTLVRLDWVRDAGSFVNWMKNLSKAGVKLTKKQLDEIVLEARRLGVSVRLDPPHPGTAWQVPHLNIGRANVHLPAPPGYQLPP